MFRIRATQVDAFRRASLDEFASRMVAHVEEHFAERCRALGAEGVRSEAVSAIERAAGHGFTSERDVCKYLNLVFSFGLDFDVDPRSAWARPILDDATFSSPSEKIASLCLAARRAARRRQGVSHE